MSTNKYIVTTELPLLEFLYNNIKNKSKNNIKSLLTRGDILVDGKVITKYDYKLQIKQIVSISSSISNKLISDKINIIYEDNDLIVVDKPAGLLTISDSNEKEKTLYHLVLQYLKNKRTHVFIVHRLDKDTSGVVVFAKNIRMKNLLQDNWNELVKKRYYVAVVLGRVAKEKDTITSYLKETKTQLVYSTTNRDGKLAITNYVTRQVSDKYSLLDISIDTGRKNQIRVHMSDIGHPILGDKKYKCSENPLNRLCLHAALIEFINPITKKTIICKSGVPIEFNRLINKGEC